MPAQLHRMTWEENEEAIGRSAVVLVPVGSTEQHGPHLPVNNDAYCAEELSLRIAEAAAQEGLKVAVGPSIAFGVSGHHMGFPGTVTLRPHLFEEVVYEVGSSLLKHGWKRLVFVNGHGGNSNALMAAIGRLANDYPDAIVVLHEWWTLIGDKLRDILEVGLFHAGEGETSLSMALGQRVLEDRMKREIPISSSKFISFNLLESVFKVGFPLPPMHRISRSGVVGDPTKASQAKGEAMLREVLARTMILLRELAEGKPMVGRTHQPN